MMGKKLLLACLTLYTAPGLIQAQDLLDTYRLGAANDPTLQAADAARLATQEIKPQGRALLFPNISVNANLTGNRQDIELPSLGTTSATTIDGGNGVDNTGARTGSSGGVSNFVSSGLTLNIVQPLYNYATGAVLRQADALVAQADAQFGVAQQDLILRISTAYFNVLAALDTLEFARAEKASIGRQLVQSKQRFEVGLIAITDVNDAQARFDLTVAQEIAAANQVANNREALREITGSPPEELAPLREKIPMPLPEPPDIERWADTALKQNLQVVAAGFAAQAAREEIDRQRGGYYPTLELVGSHSFSDSGGGRFGSAVSNNDAIGLQLNAPIYQGGLVGSRIRQAEFRAAQSRDLLEREQRAALRQTRASYLNVQASISQVKALNQAVVSTLSALEASRAGLEVGIRTGVDVLDAERQLFQARRDYAQARYNYVLEILRLKQAAGTLSVEDLEQINRWLR